ncbi:MAG: deoxyuridine 5'-triphosphate nucleotidohydrolase [Clostridiales bacterium]|nr:deoxyuridine 5'-triphosphate nucleotidohydrolase [Clostridiales bacterium]
MKIKLIDYGIQPEHLPTRAHYNDAGADVYLPDDYIILPGETVSVPLGFGIELPDGFAGFIFPRSNTAARGLTCELPPIDSGYRGEIHAILTNTGNEKIKIPKNSRIGQLVILPVIFADFTFVLSDQRGIGAFGSTGK